MHIDGDGASDVDDPRDFSFSVAYVVGWTRAETEERP